MRALLATALLAACLAAAPSSGRAPRVVSTDPAEGATGVSPKGTVVRLVFNLPMDGATLSRDTVQPGYANTEIRFFRDPFLETRYAYDEESRTLSVALPGLLPEQEVTLAVTDGARDREGRPLAGEGHLRFRLSFTTGKKD